MPKLHFRTNAKVERLIGRELITNNTIAIFELIKNSYDAGARKVEINFLNFLPHNNERGKIISTDHSVIEVADNGKGMTFNEIKEFWMELGTAHKQHNKHQELRLRSSEIETVIRRAVNGEKGIGRFGVDKIGAQLEMESIDQNLLQKTVVYFDWNEFDDTTKLIEQVPCEYTILPVPKNSESGLALKIKSLRDNWSWKDILTLKRSLKKFLSPLPINQDEFKIYLTYSYIVNGKVVKETEEIVNDAFDYLKTSIYIELDVNNEAFYEIYDREDIIEENKFKFETQHPFGAIQLQLFYLDSGDKSVFAKKMGLTTREYGNIKIFRDNFRIMPYGETHNDWLEIDNRHAQGVFRTFATRDVIGYVLLSHDPKKRNGKLKEATDRVGLIEDVPEFEELKRFIWNAIELLENYIFNRIKKQAKEASQVLKLETSGLKSDAQFLARSIKELIDNSSIAKEEKNAISKNISNQTKELLRKIDTVEFATKEIDRKIKIFSQITAKEGILYDILHSIKNKLAVIDAQIKGFNLKISMAGLEISTNPLETAVASIGDLVDGALTKVNASKLKKVNYFVEDIIHEVFESYMETLKQEGIQVNYELNSPQVRIKCTPEAFKTNVFLNLLSNSVKALSNTQNKVITIKTLVNQSYIEIYFSDNGSGIDEDNIPFIFSLWSSNTSGTGIGLATAKDTVEDHNGEIHYVDMQETNKVTTFLIKLPIIKVGEL